MTESLLSPKSTFETSNAHISIRYEAEAACASEGIIFTSGAGHSIRNQYQWESWGCANVMQDNCEDIAAGKFDWHTDDDVYEITFDVPVVSNIPIFILKDGSDSLGNLKKHEFHFLQP